MNRPTIQKADLSIFSYQEFVERLAASPTLLDRLLEVVDFDSFRSILEQPLIKKAKGPGGRPAFDAVFMFKVLILQRLYGLSDDQTEMQIWDRLSFHRFLGISVADAMPDAKTIWKYREIWTRSDTIEACFLRFNEQLEARGLFASPGKMVDATFNEAERQHNTREENEHIKENGTAPEEWDENEAKKRQKDVDARWAKKRNETHYGYKCHVMVDSLSKLIESYSTTPANVHDSNVFLEFLYEGIKDVYADSAYRSEDFEKALAELGIKSHVCKKGTRGHPLSEEDKAFNHAVAKIRCRVEHVFGQMTNIMGAMKIRCIGFVRAAGLIGLNNLAYNMIRLGQILKHKKAIA